MLDSNMRSRVQSKEEVISRIREIEPSLRHLGVRRIALFGSFVNASPRDESDVDLFVEFEDGRLNFDAFMDSIFMLEAALGRRVEVVTPGSLSAHLGPSIIREIEDVLVAA